MNSSPRALQHLTQGLRVAAAILTAVALPAAAGPLLQLTYVGLPQGPAVSTLTNAPTFPNAPSFGVPLVGGLQSPLHVLPDASGTWTRGFVEAPQTGNYSFWIASDDDAELWLSTSHDPAAQVKIAENVGFVEPMQYNLKPAQKSALIPLTAGQKYYFEVRQKEDFGGDHVSVMWQLPDGTQQDPVPARHLWPFPVDLSDPAYQAVAKAPAVLLDYAGMPVANLQPATLVNEGEPVELTVSIEATQPAYVQWYSNNVPIAGANLLSYRLPMVALAHNNVTYRLVVTNSLGQATAETMLSVMQDTIAPTLDDVLSLGNSSGTVAVIFSEAVDPVSAVAAANYSINNGVTISNRRMGAQPNIVLLETVGLAPSTAYELTVSNVRDRASTPNTIAPASVRAIETDLLTWLRLDEFAGTSINDSSVNNLDGALENGTTPGIAGKVLKCLRFDGLDDYVELPDDYADFSTGLTIALWAKPLPVPGGWARFVEMANGAFNNNNILFARNGQTDRITFQVYEGPDGRGMITTRDLLVTNQWQHLAVTLDGTGNAIVYYNGVAMATGSTAVPVNVIRTNARLGRSNWTFDTYYAGYMDDVRIYDRPLSAAAIQALAAGSGNDESPATIVSVTATVPNTALSNTPPGVLTLTRTGSTASALTVNYALLGTAVKGTHYTNLPGTVIIPAGAASAQVFVTPVDHSFTDAFRTVILQVTGTANYAMAESDAATVTIANNDDTAPPVPRVATVESRTIQVWFNEPVALPSATTLGNYSLNVGGLSITNATLTSGNISAGSYHLCVTLQVSAAVPGNAVLTVSGVQDSAGNQASYQIPVYGQLVPTRIVGNEYHGSRANAYNRVTDGTVNNANNATTGYDTFDGNSGLTHFTGLLYQEAREFSAIKVDLGQQFSDGGSWAAQPSVYLLKDYFDTDLARPEAHPSWVQVPARLVSGSQFNSAVDPNPSLNTPIVFDLTDLSPEARTAYGWAVGGVTGDGTVRFVSISELRGYGRVTGTNNLSIVHHPQSQSVVDGNQAIFTVSAKGTWPITYQWQRDQLDIPGANLASYTIPLIGVGDNAASFRVIVTNPSGSLTSQVAVLNVVAPSGPTLVAASMDVAIDVWFNQPVSPNASDPANYQLNDPGLTITGITQDAYLYRAVLSLSGTRTVNDLTVQVSNVQNLFGQPMTQQSVPVQSLAWPAVSVVGSTYQQGRGTALTVSTNGIVLHDFADFWATFGRDETDFVGLRYTEQKAFGLIKIDLGRQFGDGGSWAEYPRVYILKEPVDTDRSLPDQDPRWVEAVGAVLISGSRFDPVNDAADGEVPPNSPITFDLSSVPPAQRTGYGWAVGGVQGDNAGFPSFVSIGELRGFGVPAASPNLTIRYVGGEVIISWPASAAGYVLHSTSVLGSSANWQPVGVTPELKSGFYEVKPAAAGAPKYYRLQQ